MAPSCLDRIFVMHFQLSVCKICQVNQRNSVETPSALPAHIVRPHPTECNDETIFVKNTCVIASCNWSWNLLKPIVLFNRVHLNDWKGVAAMTPDDNCVAFVNDAGMTFARFGLPPNQTNFLVLNFVDDAFGLSFYGRLFYDFADFGIESQVFFLIFIQVEQVLVPEALFDII
jgi:hypothetical protein